MVANQWSRRRHQRIRCHTRTRRKSGGRQSLVNQSFGIQMFSARFSNLAVSSDRVAENVETRSNYSSCGMVEYAGVDFPLAQAFRECVKTRFRTRSGSDGITKSRR